MKIGLVFRSNGAFDFSRTQAPKERPKARALLRSLGMFIQLTIPFQAWLKSQAPSEPIPDPSVPPVSPHSKKANSPQADWQSTDLIPYLPLEMLAIREKSFMLWTNSFFERTSYEYAAMGIGCHHWPDRGGWL